MSSVPPVPTGEQTETLGERIARLRRALGKRLGERVSQERLAEMVGRKRGAVANWERDEKEPDRDSLVALARTFGVSVETLLTGVERAIGGSPTYEVPSMGGLRDSPAAALLAELANDPRMGGASRTVYLIEMYNRALARGLPVDEFRILDEKRNNLLRNAHQDVADQ